MDQYILDCEKGKHLQKNGIRMKPGSIQNYKSMRRVVEIFCAAKNFEIRIVDLKKCTMKQFLTEKRYWKKFNTQLSKYMYKDCNHFDNYVGTTFKLIRSFCNYLNKEKGIDTQQLQKQFYVVSEEIPIIALNPEQLNQLIYDKELEERLPLRLKVAKDVFVFGCTVGLRVSDPMSLTQANLEKVYEDYYLKVRSKKTQTFTKVKLPVYAIEILNKHKRCKPTLLPTLHLYTFNRYFREIGEMAGWTYQVNKKRQKRGIGRELKTFVKSKPYRFCDLITTHTMRRTAITTLLNLGMPEHMVRKISGHAHGSKEFFRYVQYSQNFLDQEVDNVYSKLSEIKINSARKST